MRYKENIAICFANLYASSLSVHIDPTPSVRHLCGGNILAIEKLLAFGKELQIMNKELAKERDSNEENDKLMRVRSCLLSHNRLRSFVVYFLLYRSFNLWAFKKRFLIVEFDWNENY